MEIRILENGNLKISATSEELDDLNVGEYGRETVPLAALLEPLWTNGQYYVFDADQLGHMTEAPLIAEDADCDDDGNWTLHGRVWWFPNYCVENCMDTLREKGEVIFDHAYTEEEAA